MDRKTNLIPALLLSALSLYAMEDVKVTQFQHAGPFTVNKPILTDSLNVNGKPFEAKNLLKATLPFEQTLATPRYSTLTRQAQSPSLPREKDMPCIYSLSS